MKRKLQPKAEGGGTYGLGWTGSKDGIEGLKFNDWLIQGRITWRLVDVMLPVDK